MPSSSPLSNESLARSNPDADGQSQSQSSSGRGRYDRVRWLKAPAQFVAFWAAIVLPFVHVSLLAYGLDQWPVALAFLVLLVVNVGALYIGHGYNQG